MGICNRSNEPVAPFDRHVAVGGQVLGAVEIICVEPQDFSSSYQLSAITVLPHHRQKGRLQVKPL